MLLAWTGTVLFIAVAWFSLTCCMCGHASAPTTLGVGPALLSGLWMQWKAGRVPVGYRLASWVFLAGLLWLAAKVVADMLWFGHDPLLQ
jgi:hypothetical protein